LAIQRVLLELPNNIPLNQVEAYVNHELQLNQRAFLIARVAFMTAIGIVDAWWPEPLKHWRHAAFGTAAFDQQCTNLLALNFSPEHFRRFMMRHQFNSILTPAQCLHGELCSMMTQSS
jgi:hypothetical protein